MNRPLTPSRVEAGLWLIIVVGLAVGVGLESEWGRHMQRPVTKNAETAPGFSQPVLADPFHLPDPDQFLDITLRPLFVVTRRPAPVASTADSKPSMVKAQFILMGTTIVAEGKFAFLLEKAGNKSRVVAVGKEINGILVKEVAADRVVLSQYDDTEVLLLKMNKPMPGVSAPNPFAPGMALPPPGLRPIPTPPGLAPGAGPPTAPTPGAPPPQPQPQRQLQAPAGAMIGPR